jgi:hypothetical protein
MPVRLCVRALRLVHLQTIRAQITCSCHTLAATPSLRFLMLRTQGSETSYSHRDAGHFE